MLPTGKHFYLKIHSSLETSHGSELEETDPLSPAHQHSSPSQLYILVLFLSGKFHKTFNYKTAIVFYFQTICIYASEQNLIKWHVFRDFLCQYKESSSENSKKFTVLGIE